MQTSNSNMEEDFSLPPPNLNIADFPTHKFKLFCILHCESKIVYSKVYYINSSNISQVSKLCIFKDRHNCVHWIWLHAILSINRQS